MVSALDSGASYEPIVMNENIIHALKHIIIIDTNWGFDFTN